MNIIVCIKQILDPEIPAHQFKIDPATKRQSREGISLVISPYDQNALEVALQLKEKQGGKVTALCLGEPGATSTLKSAMGMGADEAFLVSDPGLQEIDQAGVAHVLAKAVQKIGGYDLILTGCESGDWVDRVIAPFLAEELALPVAVYASQIEVRDGQAVVRKIVEDGFELVESPLPMVVSIASDETNTPRYPKLKDIMAAGRKTVPVWKAADIGVDGSRVAARRVEVENLYVPSREARCEIIEGDTPEEKAEKLARRLRELKII